MEAGSRRKREKWLWKKVRLVRKIQPELLAGFKIEQGGHKPRNVGGLQKLKKTRTQDSPLLLQK